MDDHVLTPGEVVLGRYRILHLLGQGGFGEVYRASQLSLDRDVAVKVLRKSRIGNPSVEKRFLLDAKLVCKLTSPSTVVYHDFGVEGDLLLLVMEYLPGRSLHDILKRHGRLAPRDAVSITAQVCDALQEAHRRGIIHRDIKPANVMILPTRLADGSPRVKVIDFGILKRLRQGDEPTPTTITQDGGIIGTPEYLSPEALEGDDVTPKSDQFAVATLSYQMLSGESPFRADLAVTTFMKILKTSPEELHRRSLTPPVSKSLAKVVARGMAKEPTRRFDDMHTFGQAMEAALSGDAPAPSVEGAGPTRRSPWVTVAMVTAMIAILAVLVYLLVDELTASTDPLPTTTAAELADEADESSPGTDEETTPPLRAAVPDAPQERRLPEVALASSPKVTTSASAKKSSHPASKKQPAPPPTAKATPPAKVPVTFTAKPYAEVRVDGKTIGTTPVIDYLLPKGTYEVWMTHHVFGTRKTTVTVTKPHQVVSVDYLAE